MSSECVKNLPHLPGEAPDTLVPVDGGGGAAVGVTPQHHALPQAPGESTLLSGDGGRHNNLVTTTLSDVNPWGQYTSPGACGSAPAPPPPGW